MINKYQSWCQINDPIADFYLYLIFFLYIVFTNINNRNYIFDYWTKTSQNKNTKQNKTREKITLYSKQNIYDNLIAINTDKLEKYENWNPI